MKKYLFVLGILLASTDCTLAETGTYGDYLNPKSSNTISNNRINAIAEDAQGHIWLGTFRGLNKNAVHEYHQYFCTEDSLSIPDNQIQALHKDSRGRLWVATVNGICRYTDKDNFKRVTCEGLRDKNFTQIIEDKSGRLFAYSMPFFCQYNPAKDGFEKIIESPFSFNSKAFISPSDEFWFVCGDKMLHYSGTTMQMRDSLSLDFFASNSYMTDSGHIWLFGYDRTMVYDTNTGRYMSDPDFFERHPRFAGSHVNIAHPYTDGCSILLSTEKNGMFLYNSKSRSLIHQSESTFPFEVPDFIINTIFTDSQDNIWFGSYDQGVAVHYSYKKRFNNNSFLCSALDKKSVTYIQCDSKGNVWINTLNDGLYLYDAESKSIAKMDLSTVFPEFQNHGFSTFHISDNGDVWLTSTTTVIRCTYSRGRLISHEQYPVSYPISLTEDSEGVIWIGSSHGILQYIKDNEIHYLNPITSSFTFVSSLQPLEDGILAGSFRKGLYYAKESDKLVVEAEIASRDWENCIKRSVFVPSCLFEDSQGIIWVGTVANGLMRYDRENRSLEPVPGVPCSDICSIEEDFQGNLWVSTQNGLGKYDRSVGKFINWFGVDGIGGNQFYDRSSCRMPDGTLLFGGTHGLTMFNPIDVTEKKNVTVHFEKLKVHNRPVFPGDGGTIEKAMPFNPEIVLENSQNSFSIAFSALEYGEYERVRYFYMMEGFDDGWIDAGNNREANYSNLPSGHYEFKVRVTNNDQSVVEAENSVRLTVKSPLWMSWWAKLIYIVFIVVVIAVIIRIRSQIIGEKREKQRALMEKEQEKRVNRMNMSFFANISHEFRTPLTMISGPVASLQQSRDISSEDKRLLNIVQRNINRMLRLVNQLLDFNKLENDTLKLKLHKTEIINPLRNLTDIFKVTAEEKGITFLTYGLEDSLTAYDDEDKLDKICFNLLSNAMKFTSSEGKVEFSLDVLTRDDAQSLFNLHEQDNDSRYIKISVKDTGPGIPEDQLEKVFERYYQLENQMRGAYNWGTGIGLYFAKTLAEIHHGYLKAENRTDVASGAIFTLLLPLGEISYSDEEKSFDEDKNKKPFLAKPVKYTPRPNTGNDDPHRTIVVVDDDADVAHYLKELLAPYYKVICKFNADEAFTTIKEMSPEIIVSDVVMPGKDGYELCRQIKSELQLSHIPVVLLTAQATVENQIEGLDCGADAYVTKPFDPKYLLSLIGSLLKNREKLRTLLSETTTADDIQTDTLSLQDKAFITELYALMEKELSNSELDIATMTKMLHISRSKFYYKVKGLTGENPGVFFKRYKLNRAAELLKEGKLNVSEIADLTGFSTLSHFSTAFKKHFGKAPSEWVG